MAQRRDEVLIDRAEVLRQLGGIKPRRLQELIAEGRFPTGQVLGDGKRWWMQRDVDSYLWITMRSRRTAPQKPPKTPKEKPQKAPKEHPERNS